MNRLLINTANDELVIVLQNKEKIFSSIVNSKMHHNETMLPAIDKLLKSNKLNIDDIDEFGVVIGPGSFTGIRVGIATIKAFRDATKKRAVGINNLDLLFSLAHNQNEEIDIVAIYGSRDSYFVVRKVNDIIYKYDHNLSHDELVEISNGKEIGMYAKDDSLNSFVVQFDPNVFIKTMIESNDEGLTPVYYQLSQAENEKLKRGKILLLNASKEDVNEILGIEKLSIKTNHLSKVDIENAIERESHSTFVARFDNEIVGYIIISKTDEINIESIAVKKQYRNLGIATMLINHVCEYAKLNNYKNISLEVAKTNITAYLLYDKLGFKTRRIRKNYYENNIDCLEMIKSVE